jgi:hypothetical protein
MHAGGWRRAEGLFTTQNPTGNSYFLFWGICANSKVAQMRMFFD